MPKIVGGTEWINDLPICCEGRKSRKTPTLVVGKKPYGKSRLNRIVPMKLIFFFLIVIAAIVAVAWLLPWWATLALVVLIVGPIVWIVWRIISTIKKEIVPALKKASAKLPRAQERLCDLPAGEAFRGNGFSFTFPVPCEVSQMVIDDLEVLLLKPQCGSASASGLMVLSTMPKDELKTRINSQLELIFEQLKTDLAQHAKPGEDFQMAQFQPMTLGALRGEYRTFEAATPEKKMRGETVYLGTDAFSAGWALIGPAEVFQESSERYREMAGLVKRLQDSKVVDVTATIQA